MTVEIQKGIPIPRIQGRPKGSQYPLGTMEIGDSFLLGGKERALNTAWAASVFPTRRFTVRTVTENGVKVRRVWRIA